MAEAAPLSLTNLQPAAAQQLRVRATYASLAVAVVLIAAKFIAWVGTGSVALLSSLVDSLVDAAASLVNFFAVRHAATPADREHRFGHGKAEPLAALGQSAFLVGSAMLLMAEAIRGLVSPEPVANHPTGIARCRSNLVEHTRPEIASLRSQCQSGAGHATLRKVRLCQTSESAATSVSTSASLCSGVGVRRSRSVPRGTVG